MTEHRNLFSLLHWQILLWYHARPVKYAETDPGHANSPATTEYTIQLLKMELIECGDIGPYRTTARGKALVNHILNLPLPVQAWSMP